MAHLTHKTIKGIKYYYAEERERKNGKSVRKWQKYLGPLHKIMAAVEAKPEQPKYAEIFQLGAPAAYWSIAKQTDMISIIDGVAAKRKQGLSTGFYIALAAINRCIEPASKSSMWNWFKNTALLRVFPEVSEANLTSQRFWDNMSSLKKDDIEKIWQQIIDSVLQKYNIDLSSVSFDGTNFYTFISSFNVRCSLAKRGKNKQGRRDLRQVGFALFCSKNDHIPLYFDIYEGNKPDSKEFEFVIEKFFKTFENKMSDKKAMTIVFDKGNNSNDNLKKFVEGSNYHFVGSVKPSDHKELTTVSNNDKCFIPCSDPKLEGVKAFRVKKNIYNKELTVVVTFNNKLYTTQLASINNVIIKCMEKLSLLSGKLEARRLGKIKKGRKPTVESITKQAKAICSPQHMKELVATSITVENKHPALTYTLNRDAYAELSDTYLGKNIIITDNHNWTTDEIILAYRSQHIIEDAFKQMKDRKTGSWWPMFHWTDNMIRVHGLYCSLTLLINALLMKQISDTGVKISMNNLHEKLTGIREIINVFSKNKQSVVSKLDSVQTKLFGLFKMHECVSS